MERWEQIIETVELPRPDQKVYIWGAGNTSVLNHQGMLRENLYNEFRVQGFIDTKLAGTEFNSFPVYHPDILNGHNNGEIFILISTTNRLVFCDIVKICKEKNVSYCLIDAAIVKIRKDEFTKTAKFLTVKSRLVYNRLIENRISLQDQYEEIYAGESYFGVPVFCKSSINDIIIDCGAYIGDSAERFIWRMDKFKKYIAIEPDYNNFSSMEIRFKRLREEWNLTEEKLVALYGGVDSVSSRMCIETRVDGLSSVIESNNDGDYVQIWAIDDLMNNKPFSFIKADIESFEYRMLCGAKKTIKKYHPRMAICIYHNIVDMYSIPQLVMEIEPTYTLEIRHHSYDFSETVLYAF